MSNTPPAELWFPEIKKYINKVAGNILLPAGFLFDRSTFTYRRAHRKDYEEFSLLLINKFPVDFRTSFLLHIFNHEIRQIKTAFEEKHHLENFKPRAVVFFLRDLCTGLQGFTPEPPIDHYVIVDNKDLFLAADSMGNMLLDKGLPLANRLNSIAGLDEFFRQNPGWSVNTLSLNNISTELIAASLNHPRELDSRFVVLARQLDQKISEQKIAPESAGYMQSLHDFLRRR